MLLGSALAGSINKRRDQNWKPLFNAKHYAKAQDSFNLEDRIFEKRQLKGYALKISKARKEVLEIA